MEQHIQKLLISLKMNKTFEQAIKELEKIIDDLEKGELSLKENVDKFKEGSELLNFCKKELEETEMTIKKITENNDNVSFENIT